MTTTEIIQAARGDGVQLTVTPVGTIKAKGAPEAVSRWRSTLVEHKAEIVRHLTAGTDPAPTLPEWCQSDCSCLEHIPDVGSGCVKTLADGPWTSAWRRLDTMTTCPKKMH